MRESLRTHPGRSRSRFGSPGIPISLLLILLIILPSPVFASPASPSVCTSGNYQVQAGPNPETTNNYGTGGYAKPRNAWVETTSVKVESIWVIDPASPDWVEVGWFREGGGSPRFFAAWVDLGGYGEYDGSYPTIDIFYQFRVARTTGSTWAFYLNGTPQYTRAMHFSVGKSGGMGERKNTCDSGFARWYGLESYKYYLPPTGFVWEYWTGMRQVYDSDPYYKLCILSSTDFKVRENAVDCWAP